MKNMIFLFNPRSGREQIRSQLMGIPVSYTHLSYTQYEVRSALAKCGLTTKNIESQVRVLSGGEQAKVRLCKLINRETCLLYTS